MALIFVECRFFGDEGGRQKSLPNSSALFWGKVGRDFCLPPSGKTLIKCYAFLATILDGKACLQALRHMSCLYPAVTWDIVIKQTCPWPASEENLESNIFRHPHTNSTSSPQPATPYVPSTIPFRVSISPLRRILKHEALREKHRHFCSCSDIFGDSKKAVKGEELIWKGCLHVLPPFSSHS